MATENITYIRQTDLLLLTNKGDFFFSFLTTEWNCFIKISHNNTYVTCRGRKRHPEII